MFDITTEFEIKRKSFHLCSIFLPIIYFFASKFTICTILIMGFCFTIYIDVHRNFDNKIKDVTTKVFGEILRPQEESGNFNLTGSTYMALGFLITALLFEKGLAITSWLVLIISDTMAAVIGTRFGKRLPNGKSYIGSFTFCFSAIIISIVTYFVISYNTNFFLIIFSSAVSTLVEFFSKSTKIDDNLSIPLSYAISTTALGYIF